YVRDGHTLSEYGKQSAPTAPAPGTPGPTAGDRNILAPQYAPAPASAPASSGGVTINSTVVIQGNATAADAKRIGDTQAAQVRRIWQEVSRGGARQTVTTPRTA
ncbi:MAG: hypothetical protein ACTHMP_00140, partial [Thermomicrobiales bacterium]